MRHQVAHAREIVCVYCLLQFANLTKRLDKSLQLRPTRKSIEASDLELCSGDRLGIARLHQILRLVLEMTKIGTIGKTTQRVGRIGGHNDLLSSKRPLSAQRAARRLAKLG